MNGSENVIALLPHNNLLIIMFIYCLFIIISIASKTYFKRIAREHSIDYKSHSIHIDTRICTFSFGLTVIFGVKDRVCVYLPYAIYASLFYIYKNAVNKIWKTNIMFKYFIWAPNYIHIDCCFIFGFFLKKENGFLNKFSFSFPFLFNFPEWFRCERNAIYFSVHQMTQFHEC